MNDIDRDLSALAPDDLSRVAPDWETRREQILTRITADDGTVVALDSKRPTRWRRAAVATAAAVALAVGGVTVPGMISGPAPAARADMQAMADRARGAEWMDLKPGQFVHIRWTEETIISPDMVDDPNMPQPPRLTQTREEWIDATGTLWYFQEKVIEVLPDGTRRTDPNAPLELQPGAKPDDEYPNNPSRTFIMNMPADGKELRQYLDSRVDGSTSHEEAILVAGTDMLRSEIIPPAKRAAIYEMIGENKTATTEKVTTFQKRPGLKLSWSGREHETNYLIIDEETAQVVEEGHFGTGPYAGYSYHKRYLTREIVNSRPTTPPKK